MAGRGVGKTWAVVLGAVTQFAASVLLSVALLVDPVTPDSANAARFDVEQQGQRLSAAGAHDQAAQLYWQRGIELKDPILIIDAGEAWREHAKAKRSIEAAQTAINHTLVALDMLFYLRDSSVSENWQPLASSHVHVAIARAQSTISDAQALIAEIEAEQDAANQPPPVEERKLKPGTGLIAGGSAAIVIGLGGAGLGVGGLLMGAAAQADVEDPLVYEPEHGQAEARGRRGNTFAGVGLALAGVGVGVGAALIAIGVKKRKAAGPAAGSEAVLIPSVGPQGAGLVLVGRF